MNKRTLCAAALLVAFSCLGAFAQEKKEISLTLEDSIVRALKNNLNVAVQVYEPEYARASVSKAKEFFLPTFQVSSAALRYEQPATWSLQSAGTYIQKSTNSAASIAQQIPYGGSFTVSLNYDWQKTNQLFQNFNPSFTGSLGFALTQPLLRNFGWTVSRREIIVAQTTFEASRSQFKSLLSETIYSVEQAYWNLVYAIENLQVAQQSLKLGQDLLIKTKKEVEVGQTAPIEVLRNEASVAQREAAILQAEAMVRRSRDQLKTLINLDADAQAKGATLMPADQPAFKPVQVSVDDAFQQALVKRPELEAQRFTIEGQMVNYKVAKNQILPKLDLSASYTSPGVSGDQFIFDPSNPFLPPAIGPKGSGAQAMRQAFRFLFDNWNVQLTLSIPIGDVFGRATYAQAKLNLQQEQARLKNQEQQIYLEVSDAVLTLETAAKSVDAYRVARELAEKTLEAEMKKLNVGLTTNYFVLQYQDELATARSQELKALVDYNVALAQIARVTGTSLEKRNISLADYLGNK